MLNWLKVYEICNKYDFFTHGDNYSYNKLFDMVKCGADTHDLAVAIYIVSETELTVKDIDELLKKGA